MGLLLLPPDSYQSIAGLCAPLDIHLATIAILAGETPAQVLVDDLHQPSVALLLHWDGHRAYLAGETSDQQLIREASQSLFSFFAAHNSATNAHSFGAYYASPLWESCFRLLGERMEMISLNRRQYTITQVAPDWQQRLPAAWRLRRIDQSLLAEQHLHHLPELIEEMHSESPSVEDFLRHKFGFCMQQDDTLIGWCLSEYNHGDRCEVGIEIKKDYQKQGVGWLTASALIAHALANGITRIGWHCWSDNTASNALARKLGGVCTAEHDVRLFRFAR